MGCCLELGDESCLLFDAAGRVIRFEPLAVGQQHYSASEDLWLLRGGGDATWASRAGLFQNCEMLR